MGQFNGRYMLKITCPKGKIIKLGVVLPYNVRMAYLLTNMDLFKVNKQIRR
jgi:hypothetical protein